MEQRENVHAGHRERMFKKLSTHPEFFLEHEVLEVLLYYAQPRKDTNPLAHALIHRFGSLERVLGATKEELELVDGVGEKVSNLILAVGQALKLATKNGKKVKRLEAFGKVKEEVENIFCGKALESFVVLFLDKNHIKISMLEFTDENKFEVSADIPELSKAIAVYKPCYAIVAHNHPSGVANPSAEDDLATKKINLLCEIHGVTLLDHVIYAGGECYSYHKMRRMEFIKYEADINKLMSLLKENG